MNRNFARIAIYLFPFMSDILYGLFPFVCAVRAAKLGASAQQVGLLATVTGASYMISSPLVGKILTNRNAWKLMVFSGAGQLFASIMLVTFTSLGAMYILLPFVACMAAFFFVPFQIFMKAVDNENKPIVYSVGMYTFSWSFGMATGPLVSGIIMEFGKDNPGGWKYCYAVSGAIAIISSAGVILARKLSSGEEADGTDDDEDGGKEPSVNEYRNAPDLAWLGWVFCGIAMLFLFHVKAIFPKHSEVLGLSDSVKGVVLFLLSGVQAFTGLILCISRDWMYDRKKLLGFGVLGLIGAVIFSVGESPLSFYIAASMYGIFSGSFFYYFVFHSLTHPNKSARYVSINETVVGIIGLIGPFVGGVLCDQINYSASYIILGAILLGGVIFQFVTHSRNRFRLD